MKYETHRMPTGYGQVQTAILCLPISQKSKLVYCLLASYSGSQQVCFPSLSTICNNLQMGRTTVTEAIKELQENKLIEIERRQNEHGYFESNLYYPLLYAPCSDSEHGKANNPNKVNKKNKSKSINYKQNHVRNLNTVYPDLGGSPEPVPPTGVVLNGDYGNPEPGLGVVLPQDCNNNIINNNIEHTPVLLFPDVNNNTADKPEIIKNGGKKKFPPAGAPFPNKKEYEIGVKLTHDEFTKLQQEYGEDIAKKSIEYLSMYKQEKNYKTKSDYLTIRRWVIEAVQKQVKNGYSTKQQSAFTPKNGGFQLAINSLKQGLTDLANGRTENFNFEI